MKEKIITYAVLLGLVYGIFNFDSENLWSVKTNGLSYLSFAVFIAYLAYSLKKAAKEKESH